MKECPKCNNVLEDNCDFCPYCGQSLISVESVELEKQVQSNSLNIEPPKELLPGIKELIEEHIHIANDNAGKEIVTKIFFVIKSHSHTITISSDNDCKLKLCVSFDLSKDYDRFAYDRFKSRNFDSFFYSESSLIENYSGIIEFDSFSDQVIYLLSEILIDVYKYNEKVDSSSINYSIKVDGKNCGIYKLEFGKNVKRKGCVSVIILLIIGTTFLGLI